MTSRRDWVADLANERSLIGRSSTAARVADALRTRVIEGALLPGTRLSEEDLGAALGVSRNTLREAFRLLTHERLLVHEFNRGVFVRTLTPDDVRDVYQYRRVIECAAVHQSAHAPAGALDAVRAAVEEGEAAALVDDWSTVGTANMHFHQGIVGLAGSQRLDEAARQVLAELRLVFHVMADFQRFHESYLTQNRAMYQLLRTGRIADAETELARYLDVAERQLLDAFRESA
ncbi:GntR family transcriptional regulator [Leekyejoonella antrihumi]|uniref:GntR family transcriptional regulator n=2 Tax=Leekyejoonella antrihumi TaxID=1660198 RepID=A0A563DRF0_9MICO|nr:GntR family transcriptional regulator [Leekyejoonella antrihumi]